MSIAQIAPTPEASNDNSTLLSGLSYSLSTELLDEETSSQYMDNTSGITSLNFFKGEIKDAQVTLLHRLEEILAKNPWFAGCLGKTDKVRLYSPHIQDTSNLMKRLFTIVDQEQSQLTQTTPYKQIAGLLTEYGAHVGTGSSLVRNVPKSSTGPSDTAPLVSSVTLIADAEDSKAFCLVLSISHAIADGHTYYSILNMLSIDQPIIALSPIRKFEFSTEVKEITGDAYEYSFSGRLMCGVVCSLCNLCPCSSKQPQTACHYIDQKRISALKTDQKQLDGQAYVSTNDILVHTFGNFTQVRSLFCAINLRNRLKDTKATDIDAGNYEASLVFDQEVFIPLSLSLFLSFFLFFSFFLSFSQ